MNQDETFELHVSEDEKEWTIVGETLSLIDLLKCFRSLLPFTYDYYRVVRRDKTGAVTDIIQEASHDGGTQ